MQTHTQLPIIGRTNNRIEKCEKQCRLQEVTGSFQNFETDSVSKGGLLQQPAVTDSARNTFVVDDLIHLELSMSLKAEPSGMEQTLHFESIV